MSTVMPFQPDSVVDSKSAQRLHDPTIIYIIFSFFIIVEFLVLILWYYVMYTRKLFKATYPWAICTYCE
jgi:hypothetical protein